MNRRDFMKTSGMVLGGTALAGTGALRANEARAAGDDGRPASNQGTDCKTDRVDFHHHMIPPFWAEELSSHGGDPSGWELPKWTPQSDLESMDKLGVRTGLLSVSAPGIAGWSGASALSMARRLNEYAADLVAKYPGRYGSFLTLPMQDVVGTVKEIQYGFDTLKADGVGLLSNYDGKYLGDARFEPVWAELDARSAVVYIHPTQPKLEVIPGLPGPIADYPFDTTRTALSIVSGDVVKKYKNVKIVLSHAGGYLPYAVNRFYANVARFRKGSSPEETFAELQSFYFDTALSASQPSLLALFAFAKPGHVVFGSDTPYASLARAAGFNKNLDTFDGYASGQLGAINRLSAEVMIPRLKKA